MSQLMYWVPATGSPFTPSNVSGTTITVSSTSNLTAGMYVESATYNINTTISSITNLTQFVVASATNITTSTPLNIGSWVTAVVGSQGTQGNQGYQGYQGTQGVQGLTGSQGFTGAQGATGNQGTQGFQGTQGNQGSTGTQGVQGTQGAAIALATVNLTVQSAAKAATTLYTPDSDGLFTITYYAKVTTAATTSSTLGAFSVISTDTDSNVVTTAGQSSQQNSLTSGFISGSITVYAKASTAIQYSLGYASSGATAMQYELHVVVAGTIAPSSTGTVSSFNGRTGVVTPASSDYSFSQISGTLAVASGGTGVTTSTGSSSVVLSSGATLVNPIFTGALETFNSSATALSGSTAATLAGGTSTVSVYSSNPTASFTVALTGAPTTTGQSMTYVMLVNNGSSAYLPSNITINGTQAGASSSALPLENATNNGINTLYQGGAAWASADASSYDSYSFTVMCTGSSTWILLLSQTKF